MTADDYWTNADIVDEVVKRLNDAVSEATTIGTFAVVTRDVDAEVGDALDESVVSNAYFDTLDQMQWWNL